ncbi:MAG: hypothetical protein N3E48_01805 [Candidatus Bathyarchaeota archaeon]|nr:hypothetical protein [Candidatus Bathyarchaeota archaeon]
MKNRIRNGRLNLEHFPMEGDYLESLEGIIFAVKGNIHPPTHVIAYPKYTPNGERKGYKKFLSLTDSLLFLKEKFPEYLRFDPVFNDILAEVPRTRVKRFYHPQKFLQLLLTKNNLDNLEEGSVKFVKLICKFSSVSLSSLGISGSVMVGLHKEDSDIDLVVYGVEECKVVHNALRKLSSEGLIKPYEEDKLKKLYMFRVKDSPIPFEKFVKVESRKLFQGFFNQREYFIRFIKNVWEEDEKYGKKYYKHMGSIELEADVVDDGEAIFTPSKYKLGNVSVINRTIKNPGMIKEVTSFRGRFCEQAKKFERVYVKGKLEKVLSVEGEYFRVVVGESGDLFYPKD